MNEEYTERNGRGLANLLLIIIAIGLVVALFWKLGAFGANETTQEITQETTDPSTTVYTITEAEWTSINKDLKQLRNEVAQLRNELAKSTSIAPAKTTTQTTTKPAPVVDAPTSAKKTTQTTPQTTTVNANDVTLASYSHEFLGRIARLSFKNNTDKVVTSITGRIMYYDMSGNMLDYRDFTKSTAIDPGMVKSIDLEGFRTYDEYVYYKSEDANLGTKYNVKFQLKSYKTK